MSIEAILTIASIVVGVLLFLLGLLMTVLGFLLSRQLKQIEEELDLIRPLEIRIVRVETVLGIKRPSDVIRKESPA